MEKDKFLKSFIKNLRKYYAHNNKYEIKNNIDEVYFLIYFCSINYKHVWINPVSTLSDLNIHSKVFSDISNILPKKYKHPYAFMNALLEHFDIKNDHGVYLIRLKSNVRDSEVDIGDAFNPKSIIDRSRNRTLALHNDVKDRHSTSGTSLVSKILNYF